MVLKLGSALPGGFVKTEFAGPTSGVFDSIGLGWE